MITLQDTIDTVTVEGVENVEGEEHIEIKTEEDYIQLVRTVKIEQEVSVLCWFVCVCVCMCAVLYSLYLGMPSFHTCISHLFIFCKSISTMYLCDMLRLVAVCPNYYFLFHTPHHRLHSCLGQSVLMLCKNRCG